MDHKSSCTGALAEVPPGRPKLSWRSGERTRAGQRSSCCGKPLPTTVWLSRRSPPARGFLRGSHVDKRSSTRRRGRHMTETATLRSLEATGDSSKYGVRSRRPMRGRLSGLQRAAPKRACAGPGGGEGSASQREAGCCPVASTTSASYEGPAQGDQRGDSGKARPTPNREGARTEHLRPKRVRATD